MAYAVAVCAIYVRIKELRVALGLSQAELAARAGVRRATVSRIENAHVTGIDFNVLEQLAKVLGVEPGMLLSRRLPPSGAEERERPPAPRRRGPAAAAGRAAGRRSPTRIPPRADHPT